MKYALIAVLALCSSLANAQIVTMNPSESLAAFVSRFAPENSWLTHPIIQARLGAKIGSAVISFHEHTTASEYSDNETAVEGFLYLSQGGNTYRRIAIDTYFPEGGNPVIESVFFQRDSNANARRLFVIVSWGQRHYEVNGTLYSTYAYNLSDSIRVADSLDIDETLGKKLSGGCDCVRSDGSATIAKFTTAAEVLSYLRAKKR
jgi:hypothetical protein